jgi:hypothetical protein
VDSLLDRIGFGTLPGVPPLLPAHKHFAISYLPVIDVCKIFITNGLRLKYQSINELAPEGFFPAGLCLFFLYCLSIADWS